MTVESPLLGLPTELRLQIYSHVFSLDSGDSVDNTSFEAEEAREHRLKPLHPAGEVRILISDDITSRRNNRSAQQVGMHFAAILQTCKQVHNETIGILYQQTLFRVALGADGLESVGADGKLEIHARKPKFGGYDEGDGWPLPDLGLFERVQNVQLDLNFGAQVNPIWDALPVIRAIVATLGSQRKHMTASMRFGLMTAITCARLPDAPWSKFVQELKGIDLGCVPDIEIDIEVEKWTKYGRRKFEDFRAELGGELRFVKFEERLGPHDDGLKACVIL